jgi:hypothetical protein
MDKNVDNEEQIKGTCEYYRANIQSAMEPILFDRISGIDWQVLIGTFIQDQLEDMYNMKEVDVIQYIFERKPSVRIRDIITSSRRLNEKEEERRTGFDRRGSERRI